MTTSTSNKIAELNDQFRKDFSLGIVQFTSLVAAMDVSKRDTLMAKIANYEDFDADSDPWDEHDFGSVVIDGELLFWKIDYYDLELEKHSEDPTDPTKTKRVLTVMFAEEY
jgi:hypothetical protein